MNIGDTKYIVETKNNTTKVVKVRIFSINESNGVIKLGRPRFLRSDKIHHRVTRLVFNSRREALNYFCL